MLCCRLHEGVGRPSRCRLIPRSDTVFFAPGARSDLFTLTRVCAAIVCDGPEYNSLKWLFYTLLLGVCLFFPWLAGVEV